MDFIALYNLSHGYDKTRILNIEQIILMYEKENLDIVFVSKNNHLFGEYLPDLNLINLNTKIINLKLDLDLTILHELSHARDDIIAGDYKFKSEINTDLDAYLTYYENPEILDFIYDFYNLNISKLNIK